jgi:2-polyprenyl-3-methyl-5-hydroxy-6-metoxy-1,4-benzoquinol methylase
MEKVLKKKSADSGSVDMDIYSRAPLYFHGSVPVFSHKNEYIRTYEEIANDHLSAISDSCINPWIEEKSWEILEQSTLDLVLKWSEEGKKILDVGVGLGRLLQMLPGYQRYGMDVALPYLLEAEKKGITVCMSLIEDIPYKEALFDVIVCTDVLEHVLDFHLCITKVLATLKPGGVLIIRVPYKESLEPYLNESYPYYYAHMRNFDEHSLALQLTKCFGLSVLDLTYVLYLPRLDRLRYQFPLMRGQRVLEAFFRVVEKFLPHHSKNIFSKLIEPICINMVLRKASDEINCPTV